MASTQGLLLQPPLEDFLGLLTKGMEKYISSPHVLAVVVIGRIFSNLATMWVSFRVACITRSPELMLIEYPIIARLFDCIFRRVPSDFKMIMIRIR